MPGVPKRFSEDEEVPVCQSSLEIFLYNFYKTPGVPGVPKHVSEVLEAQECMCTLKIVFKRL